MKILFASASSGSRGGGERFLVYLGRALVQRGHQVTLWASSHSRMDEVCNTFCGFGDVVRSRYVNTYDRPGRSLASYLDLFGAHRIAAEWRRLDPDIIHINKQNLEDGLDLLRAAKLARRPNLATIHLTQTAAYLKAKLAPIRDRIARRALLAYPGTLVAIAEHRWRDLLSFLGASPRIRLVPNGVPLFDLRQRDTVRTAKRAELGMKEGNLLLLAMGRMAQQKRPLLFLEKAEEIHRALPQARFLWVGEGVLSPQWDEQVRAKGLERVIFRLPWSHDIQPFLFAADVFMHVAEFEGLPLALLEAMSAGLPALMTSNLCRELPFLQNAEPLLLDSAAEVSALLADPVELRRRGLAGRGLIEREFSFARMAGEYEILYKAISSPSSVR